MPASSTSADLAGLYRDTRLRLGELVGSLGPDELAAPVPAYPGWTVADVVSHLAAVADDVLAGRLTGPPSPEQTAEQVTRLRGRTIDEVVSGWADLAPRFEEMISGFEVWPAVLDLATHEQDIRGALGQPGARDTEVVRVGAERLITLMRPPVPIVVRVEDAEFTVGPDDGTGNGRNDGTGNGMSADTDAARTAGAGADLVLDTTRFEALRWRLGRRSRAQMTNLGWSADPTPVLDHLVVFGPSSEDIHE